MVASATPEIVHLNTTVTQAPSPSHLQQMGALISLGATTLSTDNYQFCSQKSVVDNLINSSSSGNAGELQNMAATFFAQGSAVGVYVLELGNVSDVDAGVSALRTWITNNPGTFYAFLVPADWGITKDDVGSAVVTAGGSGYTSAPSVTFASPSSSSGTTAQGTATIQNGSVTGITITDSGSGYTSAPSVTISAPSSGTQATATAHLTAPMQELAADHTNPDSKLYFFITDNTANKDLYHQDKSAFVFVPSPTATSSEFGAAAPFYQWLANNPGPANKLAPMQFRYLYGVTAWQKAGNRPTIDKLLSDHDNIALTGAEGGISNVCLYKGFLANGMQASAWYGMDWIQIHVKRQLAAAIIDGSNQKNPLLYDQNGINSLEAIAQRVVNTGVKYGVILSGTVTATPFYTYTRNNPGDYKAGIYNGLSCTATFQNGFASITFYLDAVDFTAAA